MTNGCHMTDRQILTDKDREQRKIEIEAEEAANELAKKNHNFLQLTRSNIPDLLFLAKDSPIGFEIMGQMIIRMNRLNAIVISQETLATITGKNKRTIIRAIQYLKANNWIDVVNIGTANAYIVNSEVFWMGPRDERHAAFPAQVIAAEKEQKTPVKNVKLKHFPILYQNEQLTLIGEQNDQKDLDL